jgi:hypothetical protein
MLEFKLFEVFAAENDELGRLGRELVDNEFPGKEEL